ncbi:MAG: hypothetical protein ACTXOO_03565 [Sodalis sp. (in: enterobacteria)]
MQYIEPLTRPPNDTNRLGDDFSETNTTRRVLSGTWRPARLVKTHCAHAYLLARSSPNIDIHFPERRFDVSLL